MFNISNDLGQIHFSKNVIYKICRDAADSCDGAVRIMNYKGRSAAKKPGFMSVISQNEEEDTDIEIQEMDGRFRIKMYIVVRFGTSISAAADKIIDHIYDQMEALFSKKPSSVTVVVTGIASRDIAKRNIEFSR